MKKYTKKQRREITSRNIESRMADYLYDSNGHAGGASQCAKIARELVKNEKKKLKEKFINMPP